MTIKNFSQIKIAEDRVLGVSGDDSEPYREAFAREAEGLQARAYQIGLMIGMNALSCCSVTFEGGGTSFRFSTSSDDDFDAKGAYLQGDDCSVESLYRASL